MYFYASPEIEAELLPSVYLSIHPSACRYKAFASHLSPGSGFVIVLSILAINWKWPILNLLKADCIFFWFLCPKLYFLVETLYLDFKIKTLNV